MVCCELLQPLLVHANNFINAFRSVCCRKSSRTLPALRQAPFDKLRTSRTTLRIRSATFPRPREGVAHTRTSSNTGLLYLYALRTYKQGEILDHYMNPVFQITP